MFFNREFYEKVIIFSRWRVGRPPLEIINVKRRGGARDSPRARQMDSNCEVNCVPWNRPR